MLDTAGDLINASIGGVKSKIIRNVVCVGWTTNACNICAMCVHRGTGPVVTTQSSQVDLLCQGLQIFSTSVTKGHVVLTLQYAGCLENLSMEMGGQPGRQWQDKWQWCSPRYYKHRSAAHRAMD